MGSKKKKKVSRITKKLSQKTAEISGDSQAKLIEFADQLKSLNLLQLTIIKNLQQVLSATDE